MFCAVKIDYNEWFKLAQMNYLLLLFTAYCYRWLINVTQSAITCSKLTIETVEKNAKYVQS